VARNNKKRLAVDLHPVLHNALAEVSHRYNLTITDLVTELVYKFVTDDIIRNRELDERESKNLT
jgi:hypothetical protein